MKTIKNFSKVLLVAITIFSMTIISSCSKDGEPGAAGKDGVNGTNGTNGQAGTANVQYSNWLNQNWNFADTPTFKQMRVVDNRISNTFLNSGGIVLGFFRYQNNVVFQLTHISNFDKNMRSFFPVHFDTNGEIRFAIESTDGTTLTISELNGAETAQFKYVLIPGGVNISGRGITPPAYSKMTYQEVCAKFNIPE